MKVLIVPSWYTRENLPNSGVFFKEQAMALKEHGLDVTVAYPELTSLRDIKKGFVKTQLTNKKESGVMTYRYKGFHYLPKIKNGTRALFYNRLKKIYQQYVKDNGKPDLIHAHAVRWGGWAASKIATENNIPFVITEHASAYARNLIPEEDKPFIKETLESASQVITVGAGLKKELGRYIPEKKVMVIPNIVNTELFTKGKTNRQASANYRFFSLANLTYNKGMDVLIRAFAESFKGNEAVELVIGGDGEERARLEGLAVEEGVYNQVYFLGALERLEVIEQMQSCDFFVLASRYETFGVVYIEALACGKPIIATRCGGPDTIVNQSNGLLVDIDNVSELSRSLSLMAQDSGKYNSDIIRRDCEGKYSSKVVATELEKVYLDISRDD